MSKCQCEIIRNTQGVYLKDPSSNMTKPLKISPEERISAEEIMKHQEEVDVEVILTRGPGCGSQFFFFFRTPTC